VIVIGRRAESTVTKVEKTCKKEKLVVTMMVEVGE
jgi:hypothetical protein